MVVFSNIPCMQHTVSHCFWCLHSYLPSIPTHALTTLSFLNAYDCCVTGVVSASTKNGIISLLCLIMGECHLMLPNFSLLWVGILACVMLIPAISWFLFSVWLFQDNQSTMYRSEPGLYIMCTLHWCILSIMYCNAETAWWLMYWVLPLMAYGQWWCILHSWSSSGGTFLVHIVFPEPSILCSCSAAQHLLDFCWQMQLGAVLHCPVLHDAHNPCHPLPVIIWL